MSSDKLRSTLVELSSEMENSAATKNENETQPDNISSDEEEGSLNHGNELAHSRQDSHLLLPLFSHDVWPHIRIFLDSKDLLNLINSSCYFRELFLHKRAEYLKTPVLEVLMANLGHDYRNDECRKNASEILLGCRTVCKSWKSRIDQEGCSLVRFVLTQMFLFTESMDIDFFLQHFNKSHPSNLNPFPGKCICFEIQPMDEDLPQFFNRISTLLQKYGHHLVEIKFDILCIDSDNYLEFYRNFVEWFNFMPNLQNLWIDIKIPLSAVDEDQPQLQIEPPRIISSLKKLELICKPQEKTPSYWSWMEHYNLRNLVEPRNENLEYLEIGMLNWEEFVLLGMVSSPLKSLGVICWNYDYDEVKLIDVFTMLSERRFSATLEHLDVAFQVSNSSTSQLKLLKDSFCGRLNLPKVKRFSIEIYEVFSLDFLLGMRDNLEELNIICKRGPLTNVETNKSWELSVKQRILVGFIEGRMIIKFLEYQDKMLESNIWNLFPKLKAITVCIVGCEPTEFKRKDWIKKQNANNK